MLVSPNKLPTKMAQFPSSLLVVDPDVSGALPFCIAEDIYNDIIYCQSALKAHIRVHQELNNKLLIQSNRSRPKNDLLKYVEVEMDSIGSDQSSVFNRLRMDLDEYCNKMHSRRTFVSRQSMNLKVGERFKVKGVRSITVNPINVAPRRTEFELQQFVGIKPETNGTLPKTQDVTADSDSRSNSPIYPAVNNNPNPTEKVEFLLNLVDLNVPAVNHHQVANNRPQQSLLKPKSERVQFTVGSNKPHGYIWNDNITNGEEPSVTKVDAHVPVRPSPAMNTMRMRLTQALAKAKQEQMNTPKADNKPEPIVDIPEPIVVIPEPIVDIPEPADTSSPPSATPTTTRSNTSSPISSDEHSASSGSSARSVVTSKRTKNTAPARRAANKKRARGVKSPSPASSSMDSVDGADLPEEDEEPSILGKEAFLRVFGLCTHNYHAFLTSRRSERKRRNVTSTEKGDFHYGKLDLYEQQHSNKTSKRPVLYSPPQTRGVRRRVNPNVPVPKPTVSVAVPIKVHAKKVPKKSRENSSAGSEDTNNMCMSCTTTIKEKLFECEACNAFYHMTCHKTASIMASANGSSSSNSSSSHASGTSSAGREKFCPDCLRRRQTNNVSKSK